MKRLLAATLAFALTALCLWLLLTPDILRAAVGLVKEARPLPIVVAFALFTLVQWLRAWRFSLMTTRRLALPGGKLVQIAFQLNFLNLIVPFRLGEAGYPLLMRRHYGHDLVRSTGILMLARVFDLVTVVSIMLGAAAVLQLAGRAGNLALALVGLVLGLVPFGVAILADSALSQICMRRRVGHPLTTLLTAGLDNIRDRWVGLTAAALSLGIWLAFGVAAILIADAVANTVSAPAAIFGAAAGNIAFALPINGIAGIGPAQAAWVAATTLAGVPWDEAVLTALALHAVVLINSVLLGTLASLPDINRLFIASADK